MKCSRCYALFAPGETSCIACGESLAVANRAAGLGATQTPAWAYLFAAACGLIPIVALGGAIPIMLGFGGAGGCMAVARARSVPLVLRVAGCVGITTGCWFLFVVLIAVVVAATAK